MKTLGHDERPMDTLYKDRLYHKYDMSRLPAEIKSTFVMSMMWMAHVEIPKMLKERF